MATIYQCDKCKQQFKYGAKGGVQGFVYYWGPLSRLSIGDKGFDLCESCYKDMEKLFLKNLDNAKD